MALLREATRGTQRGGDLEVLFREARRRRRRRRLLVVAVAAVAVLVASVVHASGGGGSPSRQQTRLPGPGAVGPTGSGNVLALADGVVWSSALQGGSDVVYRSVDAGRAWTRVLHNSKGLGIVADYFVGTQDAWAADETDTAATTVSHTTDGGAHWDRVVLPAVNAGPVLSERFTFSDPRHGWLLGVQGPSSRLQMVWWSTSDGGRHWVARSPAQLPAQGVAQKSSETCSESSMPSLSFVSPSVGWFTQGSCGSGPAEPHVWRTGDGGRHWLSSPLPAPAGGWGTWDVLHQGGTAVGAVSHFGGARSGVLLTPVAVSASRLVVERSDDEGRTWKIASEAGTSAAPGLTTAADWFDPLSSQRWVVSGPGLLLETADGGQRWTSVRPDLLWPGQPVSFTSLRDGWVEGEGVAVAARTLDAGRHWRLEHGNVPVATVLAGDKDVVSVVQRVDAHLSVAAGDIGLETSTNGGRTWTLRLTASTPVQQVDFVSGRLGFAVTGGELLRSSDSGETWAPMLQPKSGAVSAVAFWSADDGVADAPGGLVTTDNGGASWSRLRAPAGWSLSRTRGALGDTPAAACFTSGGTGWAIVTRGDRSEVVVTVDSGRHWRVSLPATTFPPPTAETAGGTIGLGGCSGTRAAVVVSETDGPIESMGAPVVWNLLTTSDRGRTWSDVLRSSGSIVAPLSHVTPPTGGPPPAAAPFDAVLPSVAYGAGAIWVSGLNQDSGQLGVASSRDDGSSWTMTSSSTGTSGFARSLLPSTIYPWNADNAWAVGRSGDADDPDGRLYATADGGRHWRYVRRLGP